MTSGIEEAERAQNEVEVAVKPQESVSPHEEERKLRTQTRAAGTKGRPKRGTNQKNKQMAVKEVSEEEEGTALRLSALAESLPSSSMKDGVK